MSKYGDVRNIRVLAFLDAYERQRCLWDTSLDGYKNKADRDEAYLAIIKELDVPMLSVHDIKLKVKGVRTTYTKELRLLNAHKKLGKPYKPKLFWFNKANSFLKNVCVSRRKKELIPKEDASMQNDSKDITLDYADEAYSGEEFVAESELVDDDQAQMVDAEDFKTFIRVVKEADVQEYDLKKNSIVEQSYHEEQYTDSPRSNSNPRHEIISNTYDDAPPISSATNKEDEFDLFCRSVAIQLRSIPDSYSRSMAKLKIQQILFEAETGHYKNSPLITIPIVQQLNNV